MKTRKEIIDNLALCKKKFAGEYGITKLGLFGSYAREEQTSASDVDVYVVVSPSIGLNFVTLAEKIEREMGLPTDVVSSRGIKRHYLKEIESEIIYV